jgi:putative PEP-CTERM system histidine kinase
MRSGSCPSGGARRATSAAVISSLGYIVTAILFSGFALLLATLWRSRQKSGLLLVACSASVVWAALYALRSSSFGAPLLVLSIADVLRAGAWFAYVGGLLVSLGMRRRLQSLLHGLWLSALVAVLALQVGQPLSGVGFDALMFVELLVALMGLVLVEQLFRNAPKPSLWALKYLCLGIGLVFAFDLYMFSENVLLNSIDSDLINARGYVNAVSVPVVVLAMRRNPRLDVDLSLSHRMVFFATTLAAVGAYLLLMALGGYYVRYYGGGWGRVAQVTFFAGSLLVLLALLFSDTVRSRFRVFVQKHFQRYKYDYRNEWLRFTETLSAAAGEVDIREISIKAMADIVGSPGGVMWFGDESGRCYSAVASVPYKLDERSRALASDSLPVFLAERGWIVNLQEYRAAPDRYGELALPEWLTRRGSAWLVVPLLLGSALVGFIVLDEPPVLPELNFEDHDLLKTVGRDVATHVSQFEASCQLAESRQFMAYHQLSAFVMHDLKNLIAQLSLVVRNAEKHRRNPEFVDDSIATIANSVDRMNRLMVQLSGGRQGPVLGKTSLRRVLESTVQRCEGRHPRPRLVLEHPDADVMADADRLVSMFEHVVGNAQDACDGGGSVLITLKLDGDTASIAIADDGVGMDREFVRTRLFSPFDTTKGSKGMGIGTYQAREYVRALGGDIWVRSEAGRGTTFEIRLPTAELSSQRIA